MPTGAPGAATSLQIHFTFPIGQTATSNMSTMLITIVVS
jgi:hypothetical protein